MKKGHILARTHRLVAALREMASLGITQRAAARLLSKTAERVWQLNRQFAIGFKPRRGERPATTQRRQVIRDGYAALLPPSEIAARVGMTPQSVIVTASRMGLGKGVQDPYRFHRGFAVPDDMREEYRSLRLLGLTATEAGQNLGIIPREPVTNG